jgi:hypothetical protein
MPFNTHNSRAAAASAFAILQQINYQGNLNSATGVPLDTAIAVNFNLYADSLSGPSLWSDAHSTVSVVHGLFNVSLGQVSNLDPGLLSRSSLWLGVRVGGDNEMSPRNQILSDGYAFRVGTVDGAADGNITSDVNISGRLNIGTNNSGATSYKVYRDTTALFFPTPSKLLGTTADAHYMDSNVIGQSATKNYYNVTAATTCTAADALPAVQTEPGIPVKQSSELSTHLTVGGVGNESASELACLTSEGVSVALGGEAGELIWEVATPTSHSRNRSHIFVRSTTKRS